MSLEADKALTRRAGPDRIVGLDRSSLRGALALTRSAGWNQNRRDWARLLRLEPEGCFGIECDGALVATTTAVCYGRALAWIGMVFTHPGYRGLGLAHRLVGHAIEFAESRGVGWIKLDATDMGRRLYRRLGFEDECEVERWVRPASRAPPARGAVEPFRLDPALDLEAFGADRGRLLEVLAGEGEGASLPGGYALGRPGAETFHFGPCVARDARAACTLLAWFLERHAGTPTSWDILQTNPDAGRLARERGFTAGRQLVRMVRRARGGDSGFSSNDRLAFAAAGFEYG